MHLLLIVMCPETRGLDHHTDLTDPQIIIPNAARVLFCNRAAMVVEK
jgi:hypothetical protein